MMHGMVVSPACKRREKHQPKHRTEPRIRPPPRQERSVRAVVEQDVGPKPEPSSRYRQRQDEKVGDLQREVHQRPKPYEMHYRGSEGDDAPPEIRASRAIQAFPPGRAFLTQPPG